MLIGLGLLFTIRPGFVQFRYFGNMFSIFGHAFERQPGQLSSFQALMLSVAGRVGAGNIAGVSVAIMLGGPGRSEEHTSELQSLMRISYAVFCLKKKKDV